MSREGRSKWNIVGLLLFVVANIILLWGVVPHQRTDISHTRVQPYRDLSWAGQGVTSAQPTYNAVSKQVQTSNTQNPPTSRNLSSTDAQRTRPTAGGVKTTAAPIDQYGYLLGLNSSDALTGGAMNILSYQCMASKLSPKVLVVEPFVMNSMYGGVLKWRIRRALTERTTSS